MGGANRVSPPDAYLQQMRERMEQALRRVAQAVNDAPDGAWINGSEWQVFHEFNDQRRDAFERALQMRADAAASPIAFALARLRCYLLRRAREAHVSHPGDRA